MSSYIFRLLSGLNGDSLAVLFGGESGGHLMALSDIVENCKDFCERFKTVEFVPRCSSIYP
jgi:hypothetical protein